MKKRGAMELSIGTIVIIVIAMSMLILGLVLVRNIMCGAIGLTGELNKKVMNELEKMFNEGEEVACIGEGEVPAQLIPGKTNIIYCAIRADTETTYTISLEGIDTESPLTESQVMDWIKVGGEGWSGVISPGDTKPKKVLRLNVPKDAPHVSIVIHLKIEKEGGGTISRDLDFKITKMNFFKSAVC